MKPVLWTVVAILISDCSVGQIKNHKDTHSFSVNNSPITLKQSKYFCDLQLPNCDGGGWGMGGMEFFLSLLKNENPSTKGSVANVRGKKKSQE